MEAYHDPEFRQFAAENNLSEDDLQYIRLEIRRRLCFWWCLTLIPGVALFILPVLVQTWLEYKLFKQRTFAHTRLGLFLTLYTMAMFMTFLLLFPIAVWEIVKRKKSVVAGLMKKGLVGDGPYGPPRRKAWRKLRIASRVTCFLAVPVLTAALCVILRLTVAAELSVWLFALLAAAVLIVLWFIGLSVCSIVDQIRYKRYLRNEE